MKNIFKLFVPVAAAAIALVSCQPKEEQIGNNPAGEVTIRVHASAQAIAGEDTKTYIDTYKGTANTILWGTGEYMKLALTAGETTTFANSTDASADTFDGEPEAMFEFSVTPGAANEYVYQGLYPASAAVASSNTNAANYKVNLPAIQNATATSYDPAAYIMVAKPETFTSVQTDWEASYRRATALNKITLKNVPNGVSIKRVKITAPTGKYLAGSRYINIATEDPDAVMGDIYANGGRTETIEVKYANAISGPNVDVWFTSWGAEIVEGEKLTIVAYTTDNKSYTKEITVPVGKTIKFQEGYLNTLGAKMENITPETVTELEEGDYVILAKDGENYFALKAETAGSNNDKIAAVSYPGSLSSYAGSSDIIWSVSKSGNSYVISNDGKNIGWEKGNTALWLAAGESWTTTNYLIDIVWDSTNNCYNATLNSNSSEKFQKNGSAEYFAFYTSSQKDQLFFVPATVDNRTPASLTFSDSVVELTTATGSYDQFFGQDVIASPNVAAITGNLTWNYEDNDGIIDAFDNGTIILTGNTGNATITASFAGDETYTPSTASYSITVTEYVPIDYSTAGTSNVTLSTTGGTSASKATVNTYEALKAGTGSAAGAVKITVPANTTNLHLHAAGWNGESVKLSITGATANPTSLSLTSNTGISGNSPFTLSEGSNVADYYFNVALFGISAETTLTFSATSGKRFVIWGVNAVADTRENAPISWSAETGTATFSSNGISYSLPSFENTNALSVSYSSSEESVATINASGEITAIAAGTSTISATYDGSASNAPYKTTTVSYTLTVTDNRTACATPSFSPAAGEVTSGTTITISSATEGASIYYTTGSSDFSAGDWTAYTEPIAITSACTIKAIAVKSNFKDSEVSSAAYTITVPTVGSGTEADPYTAGDILDKYPSGSGDTEVYVTGTITNIQEVSTNFGNATYTISDGSRNILVYRGKYIGNVNFTSEDQIALDDIVVVFGKIGVYQEKPQLAQNNYLISITKDTTTPTISVSPASLSWEATETDSKTLTVTLNGSASKGDYNYSVTSGTAADWTISDNGEGVITVTPNAANTDKNNAKEITITIAHKSDSNVKQEVTCSQAKASSGDTQSYVDVLTADCFAATNTTYTDFTNKTPGGDNHSSAIYAGNSAKTSSGGIQLRSKNSNSGIVTTTSGGKVKSVKITVESGSNTVDIYGKNSAYTAASDLYNSSNQGTKIGSTSSSTTVTITGDYQYIGIRSNNGALYLTSVEITWEN